MAVLGAGQLGRMLGVAGLALGVEMRFLDPAADAVAAATGPLTVAPLDDADAAVGLAAGATVVTYEWEGVAAATATAAATRAPVRPAPAALTVAQDRLSEKQAFAELDIPTATFAPADDRRGLDAAFERTGMPAVVKTRRGGYDGKGQRVVRDGGDVDATWRALGGVPLLVEAMIPFQRELAVLAVRALDGTTLTYPLVETVQRDGVLRSARAPAPHTSPGLQRAAASIATRLLDHLDYVGVLAVELFDDGARLLANELAPRVHNSGHWTIEGAETSQFENHLRAVLGWPLGSTAPVGHSGLVNLLGARPDPAAVLAVPGAHLHDYRKADRPGRKVGHATVTAPTPAERDERLRALAAVVDAGSS